MTKPGTISSTVKPASAVHAIQRELRAQVARKGSSLSALERALGLSRGYVSQVLNGKIDLKVELVFAVLEELGVEPADFFSAVLVTDLWRGQFDALVARQRAIASARASDGQVREAEAEYPQREDAEHSRRDVQESLAELFERIAKLEAMADVKGNMS